MDTKQENNMTIKSTLILALLAVLLSCAVMLVVLLTQDTTPLDVLNDCTQQIVGNCIVK